jgi:hypothetical protein
MTKFLLAALLLTPSLVAQTATTPEPQSNPELTLMFQEDQRIRSGGPLSAEERARITRTDADRLAAVKQMVANDQLHTAHDYRNAALILQHSQKSDDYLLAHTLAVIGANKGDKTCAWLSAATLDRYLQSIGQPQIYGTQFKPRTSSTSVWTQEPYTSDLVTDAVRKELGVPPLDEQKKQFDTLNNRAAKQSK